MMSYFKYYKKVPNKEVVYNEWMRLRKESYL